jgi:hypothetical protein
VALKHTIDVCYNTIGPRINEVKIITHNNLPVDVEMFKGGYPDAYKEILEAIKINSAEYWKQNQSVNKVEDFKYFNS